MPPRSSRTSSPRQAACMTSVPARVWRPAAAPASPTRSAARPAACMSRAISPAARSTTSDARSASRPRSSIAAPARSASRTISPAAVSTPREARSRRSSSADAPAPRRRCASSTRSIDPRSGRVRSSTRSRCSAARQSFATLYLFSPEESGAEGVAHRAHLDLARGVRPLQRRVRLAERQVGDIDPRPPLDIQTLPLVVAQISRVSVSASEPSKGRICSETNCPVARG